VEEARLPSQPFLGGPRLSLYVASNKEIMIIRKWIWNVHARKLHLREQCKGCALLLQDGDMCCMHARIQGDMVQEHNCAYRLCVQEALCIMLLLE